MGTFANRKTPVSDKAGILAAMLPPPTEAAQMSMDGMSAPGRALMLATQPQGGVDVSRLSGPINPGFGEMLMQVTRPPERSLGDAIPQLSLSAPVSNDPMKLDAMAGLSSLDNFRAKQVHPHFFDKDGLGSKLGRGLAEFALQYSASSGEPGALQTLRQRAQAADDARAEAVWSRRHTLERTEAEADRLARLNDPQYFNAGDDRVRLDPATGQSTVLYHGPSTAERYATALGYDPGTDDYRTAIQDATLRSNGPSAYDNRIGIEGVTD